MIERDRELLARVARVNRHLGELVVGLMGLQDDGELPAGEVRALGQHLAELSTDLLARAAELDSHTPERVVIDAHT